mgnify:CR=1 FL=1
MRLSTETAATIKKWKGFEDFDDENVEYVSKDPEIFSDCELTLLMKAIEEDDVEVVQALCDAGVNVNRVAKETNQVPLMCFDEDSLNSAEISKILIAFGADVNYLRPSCFNDIESFNGLFSSPLIDAIDAGDFQRVKLLIDSGADVNLCSVKNGFCAISQLNPMNNDYLKILKLLVDNGANINADNSSALKMAVEIGNIKAIELLLENGANPDLFGGNGENALTTCLNSTFGIIEGNYLNDQEEEYVFDLLLDHANDFNFTNEDGKSLLSLVLDSTIGGDNFKILAFSKILKKGIDINFVDAEGNNALFTVLEYIELYGNSSSIYFDIDEYKMINLLIKKGVNLDTLDKYDNSALDYALTIGNIEIINLIETGVDEIDDLQECFDTYEKLREVLNQEEEEEEEEEEEPTKRAGYKKKIFEPTSRVKKVNLITKLFKSREIIEILQELNNIESEFNNENFSLVKHYVKKAISKNSKSLIQEIKNGKSSRFLAYNMVNIFSGDLFQTGKYPYRSIFGDLSGSGFYLLAIFEKSLDELIAMGKISEEHAKEQKDIIRNNMNYLISKPLPFM